MWKFPRHKQQISNQMSTAFLTLRKLSRSVEIPFSNHQFTSQRMMKEPTPPMQLQSKALTNDVLGAPLWRYSWSKTNLFFLLLEVWWGELKRGDELLFAASISLTTRHVNLSSQDLLWCMWLLLKSVRVWASGGPVAFYPQQAIFLS